MWLDITGLNDKQCHEESQYLTPAKGVDGSDWCPELQLMPNVLLTEVVLRIRCESWSR